MRCCDGRADRDSQRGSWRGLRGPVRMTMGVGNWIARAGNLSSVPAPMCR
jgi:hypothetical protein